MLGSFLRSIAPHIASRLNWGVILTALVPLTLVVGRAPADILVSLVALLFLLDCGIRRDWSWVRRGWALAALALWGYSLARAAFIPDGGNGLFHAFVWLRYIVFAASLAHWTLASDKGKRFLLATTGATVLFLAGDGLFQYIVGHDIFGRPTGDIYRLTGPYGRPILGMTIALLMAPPVFWLLRQKKAFASIGLGALCFTTVFLSGERMALVLAAVVMATWFVFLAILRERRWTNLGLCAVVFAAFLTLPPLLSKNELSIANRQLTSTLQTSQNFAASAYGMVWKSALAVGRDSPFFGVGMRQFRDVCQDTRYGPVEDAKTGFSRCFTHPHNAYLEWFAEGGFVGLGFFALFVLTLAVELMRRLKGALADPLIWGLAATIGVRLVPIFITTSFFNNWVAIPFWLAVGWAMSYPPVPLLRKRSAP